MEALMQLSNGRLSYDDEGTETVLRLEAYRQHCRLERSRLDAMEGEEEL